ncbi:MAG: TonB-dependent receptor plug [Mucilaginibacter sp.]|nr:TonB-dependent receptor plug [Mucilaginibacter sp.]
MKQFLLALGLCLCLIKSVCAQKSSGDNGGIIDGIIHDEQHNPIQGATVILKKQDDSSLIVKEISKANGTFQFSNVLPGIYTISITHVGYSPYIIKQVIMETRNLHLSDIKLLLNTGELKEVIVTSPPKSFIEQKPDRMIVNVGALMSNTGTNAIDVLNNSPAVQVSDDGISLRGKEGVTIYIDDRPSNLTGADLINYLKTLPSGTLDKIEIMTNPPARYNAEGTAGIINIKTKKSKARGFNAGISLTYQQGVYSKNNSNINFNYRINKINFFGNLGYSSFNNFYNVKRSRNFNYPTDSASLLLYQLNTEKSNTKSYNYKLGLDYDVNAHTSIGILVNGIINPYTEHGNYSVTFNRSNRVDSVINTISQLNYITRNNTVNLNFRHQFHRPVQEINLNVDYLHYSTDPLQTINSSTYLPDRSLISNYTLNTYNPFIANIFGAKADYDDELFNGIKMSVGLQTTYSVRSSTGNYLYTMNNLTYANDSLDGSFRYKENINAAYASFQKTLKRFAIQAGLRFENTHAQTNQQRNAATTNTIVQYNYNNLFPTAYVSYKLDTGAVNTLILSVGRRISRPDYSDLNSFVFTFDKYSSNKGNPGLLPAFSNELDLSYNHKDKIIAGITYSKTYHDITQYYQLNGYATAFTPVNIEKAIAYGLYLNLSLPVNSWWSANVYTDLNQNRYEGQILNAEYLNNKVTTFTINGSNQFKFKNGWGFEINGFYRNNLTYGQGIYLPTWRLNASVQKTVLKNKGTIVLTARDIFNTRTLRRQIEYQYATFSTLNRSDTQVIGLTFTYKFGISTAARQHKNSIQTEAGRAGAN